MTSLRWCSTLTLLVSLRLPSGLFASSIYSTASVDAPEYCMNEMFQARCARDEVIVMKSAFYGRMHISRCVTVDMGYLGCSSDVLDLADQRCSGRRECELRMPYPAFEETRPCYDLQSFFKADFYCLKVFAPASEDCERSRQIRLPSPRGRIASTTTFESRWCGTAESPWLIEVPPGQRINITLIDFGLQSGQVRLSALTSSSSRRKSVSRRPQRPGVSDHQVAASRPPCRVRYAVLTDRMSERSSVEVCGSGNSSRERHVYLSTGNVLEISVDVRRDSPDYFVLLYEAVGCTNPVLGPGMFHKRDPSSSSDDVIIVGCRATNERWRLTCVSGVWTGDVIGNCSAGEMRTLGSHVSRQTQRLSRPLIVGLVCSLALIIGSIVTVLALVLVRRRWWTSSKSSAGETATDPHPVSPKSLVSEVDDEMYLRPSNGCHGDGASSSNSTSSPPGYVAPEAPPIEGRSSDQTAASASQQQQQGCSECCCCCNAEVCGPPAATGKDAPVAGPSTLGPPSRTGRLRQAAAVAAGTTATGGSHHGPAYRRAASCIEQNKFTHIWQMPLPIPGE